VPLGVDGLYTYSMPPEWGSGLGATTDLVGCRVRVPFGKRKQYVGLVMEVHQNQPSYPIKEALERLDSRPIWGRHGQDLWGWMLRYYLCSPGALMGLALPALLRVGSESVLVAMDLVEEEGSDRWQDLHPLSKQLWERLRQGPGMSLEAVQRWMVPHNPSPWIQELMEAGLIGTLENFSKIYRPKSEAWVAKGPRWLAEGAAIMLELERSPRQLEFVMAMHAVAAGSDQAPPFGGFSQTQADTDPDRRPSKPGRKGLVAPFDAVGPQGSAQGGPSTTSGT
jgi:Primosomal protein N'' (replication factor Y) - superfamily II helicase